MRRITLLRSACLGLLLSGQGVGVAWAQSYGESPSPAVQNAEDLARQAAQNARLSAQNARLAYLRGLSVNPRDYSALIGAGEASLQLREANAAYGYFKRAEAISPTDGRVKAGMGRALLAMQKIDDAISAFDQASAVGYVDHDMLIDRGLARDLRGNQIGAQQDYAAALRLMPGDAETIRRYAVSLGISGKVDQADAMVSPLLYKSDRPAWRDRAFIMAMNGRHAQADAIIQRVMPADLAVEIQPYMDRMHMLTPLQRAEAVYLGKFPAGLVQMAVVAVPDASLASSDTRTRRKGGKAKAQTGVDLALAPTVPPPQMVQSIPPSVARSTYVPVSPPAQVAVVQPVAPPQVTAAQPAQAQAAAPPAMVQSVTSSASSSAIAQAIPSVAAVAPAASVAPVKPTAVASSLPQAPSIPQATASAPVAAVALPVQGPPDPAVVPAPSFSASVSPVGSSPVPAAPVHSTVTETRTETVATVVSLPDVASAASPTPPSAQPVTPPVAAAPATFTASDATTAPAPTETRSLADIMASVKVPEAERQAVVAPVDLKEVAALQAERRKVRLAIEAKAKAVADAKAKAAEDAKAKAAADAEKKRLAANPARFWVQLATGQNVTALAFDLRRFKKQYPDEIGSKSGATAPWGSTNRLVVGPFPTAAKAKDYAAALRKAGADVMLWNSDAGEEVAQIGGK